MLKRTSLKIIHTVDNSDDENTDFCFDAKGTVDAYCLEKIKMTPRPTTKKKVCSAVLLFFLFIYLLCMSFKPGFIVLVNLHLEATTRSSRQVFNPLNRCEC